MSVTITFHTLKEKKPAHGESVIVLKPTYSFGYQGFNPIHRHAEYCWFEVDDDGDDTGAQYTYDDGDPLLEGCDLRILVDGYVMDDDWMWISEEEYWKCFPAEEE